MRAPGSGDCPRGLLLCLTCDFIEATGVPNLKAQSPSERAGSAPLRVRTKPGWESSSDNDTAELDFRGCSE